VPWGLVQIQTTPPHVHPALILALELILVVTMPGVVKTFKTVIEEMTHGTDLNLVNMFYAKNEHLTHKDLNICIKKQGN